MSSALLIFSLLSLVVIVYAGIALVAYVRFRGRHVVVCPATKTSSAVKVDGLHAALSAMWDRAEVRIADCTRWPRAAKCSQTCAAQVAAAPKDTTPEAMFTRWYAGKSCAICRRSISPVRTMEPHPGLYNVAARTVVNWEDIPPETIPAALESHLPVCENCVLVESFRRQRPDLVIDRADTDKRDLVIH